MDEIEVKLPISGATVVIRNYTTRKDDEASEAVLYKDVSAVQSGDSAQEVSFPIGNVMASQRAYIPRLVKSIDGKSNNVAALIDELRTEDYAAIEEAVSKITEEHSPKAKAA